MHKHWVIVDNCIGLYNLRYYLLFLFHATLGIGMLVYSLLSNDEIRTNVETSKLDYIIWIIMLSLNMVAFFYILPSTVINWWTILSGKTQEEILNGLFDDRGDDEAKKNEEDELAEYNDQLAEFL